MGEILRHKKTGGLYEVLFRGAQIQTGKPLADYALVMAYQQIDGPVVVQPIDAPSRHDWIPIYEGRIQTSSTLTEGAEVVIYRALTDAKVWVRRTSEMDDGRFEPAGAPQPPSSTPGEAERLVERLETLARQHETLLYGPGQGLEAARVADEIKLTRTALLSHISTAGRGEGDGDLASQAYDLGFASSAEGWNGEYPNNATETEGYARTRAENLACLLNKLAADATNPQDQE